METTDFGWALNQLRDGARVARNGWNGKGMFIFLVSHWSINTAHMSNWSTELAPFIAMKTAQDTIIPWLASQADMLATDWVIATD